MSNNREITSDFNSANYIGREIKGITLLELIGRGSMGAVFVGFQRSLKRKVAVKIIQKTNNALSLTKLCFRDEAETVAVLNHPNIAPVFDMGETEDLLFLSMQLINGEDIRCILQRIRNNPIPSKRYLSVKYVINILMKVLDALEYVHNERVIHQDIKPGNIIIEKRTQRPFLVDFGIAHSTIAETDTSKFIFGTPLYMAPEQICSQIPDLRSDIYSSGMVLYEALAGKLPVVSMKSDLIMEMKIKDPERIFTCLPSQTSSSITPEIGSIIQKAINVNPDNRYQCCREFKKDLENIVKSLH